jgi:hypothetical protein
MPLPQALDELLVDLGTTMGSPCFPKDIEATPLLLVETTW